MNRENKLRVMYHDVPVGVLALTKNQRPADILEQEDLIVCTLPKESR